MKIAMLGLKGLPGIHGGVEKHVEELGARLAAKGHEITVFCRKKYTPAPCTYRGMNLVLAPTFHTKHLDATVHTLLGGISAGFGHFDLVHYHAIGPSSMSFIARAFGKPVISTIHSLDYLRDKWGATAKWALRRAEEATLLFANRVIVVSRRLENRYTNKSKPVTFIPNGVGTPIFRKPDLIRKQLNLEGNDYIFWAGRFSTEKGVHYLVDAFRALKTDMRLVLAGGGNHTEKYVQELYSKIKADKRIIAPGYVAGPLLEELFSNAALFVLPSEHEGMPIALLEAMSYKLPCLATDIPACREVAMADGEPLVDFVVPKDIADLTDKLQNAIMVPERLEKKASKAKKHVLNKYHWDSIVEEVEREYALLLGATP